MIAINTKINAQTNTAFRSFRILSTSNVDSINRFLSSVNAAEIDFNSNKKCAYVLRIRIDNNWTLATEVWNEDEDHFDDNGNPIQLFYGYKFYGKEGYSFLFPDEDENFTIAGKQNKKYIVSLPQCNIDHFWFDEIQNIYKTSNVHDENYKIYYCSKIRRGESWALGIINDGTIMQLSSFEHDENFLIDSILVGMNILQYSTDFDIELINIDCAKKTNQLFMDLPNLSQVIQHDEIYEVWKNNLAGFYNNDLTKHQSIEFEEIEVVNLDYMTAIALKKNGKWSFYNAEDATLLFDSQAETLKELINLWLDR